MKIQSQRMWKETSAGPKARAGFMQPEEKVPNARRVKKRAPPMATGPAFPAVLLRFMHVSSTTRVRMRVPIISAAETIPAS
jgi:hypothetical protein